MSTRKQPQGGRSEDSPVVGQHRSYEEFRRQGSHHQVKGVVMISLRGGTPDERGD